MACEHKSQGETVWLNAEYRGLHIGLKKHPFCSKCGLIKSVSSEGAKPLGYYLNLLGSLSRAYSLKQVQIRLISNELECLEDPYGFSKTQQEKVFLETVLKYTSIPEQSIAEMLK